VCKKLIKNSQPFGKKFQKTVGGGIFFFDSHCMYLHFSDLSTDNLKYLSSEQALADLAYFRVYMSDKLKLSGNKWIAFGGSYPGGCHIILPSEMRLNRTLCD